MSSDEVTLNQNISEITGIKFQIPTYRHEPICSVLGNGTKNAKEKLTATAQHQL